MITAAAIRKLVIEPTRCLCTSLLAAAARKATAPLHNSGSSMATLVGRIKKQTAMSQLSATIDPAGLSLRPDHGQSARIEVIKQASTELTSERDMQ
mmetsp:Transcript_25594/g.84549  ORF Transcript_25594/g.84549 Transcript_25594/m.84549 type:complete len:96 (+) Transcript_25594:946-1233(+)